MTKRLPNWVEWGAWLLAFTAGGINAVGLLSFEHQAISHVTGSVSWLGLELARGEGSAALHLALVVLVFFLGAAVSGALLEDSTLRLLASRGLSAQGREHLALLRSGVQEILCDWIAEGINLRNGNLEHSRKGRVPFEGRGCKRDVCPLSSAMQIVIFMKLTFPN